MEYKISTPRDEDCWFSDDPHQSFRIDFDITSHDQRETLLMLDNLTRSIKALPGMWHAFAANMKPALGVPYSYVDKRSVGYPGRYTIFVTSYPGMDVYASVCALLEAELAVVAAN